MFHFNYIFPTKKLFIFLQEKHIGNTWCVSIQIFPKEKYVVAWSVIICTLLHDMYISISYVHYSDEGIVVVEIKDLNYWATREGEDKEEKI